MMVSSAHLVFPQIRASACCRARPPLTVLRPQLPQTVAPAMAPAMAPQVCHAGPNVQRPLQGPMAPHWGPRPRHPPLRRSGTTPACAPAPLVHSRGPGARSPQLQRQHRVLSSGHGGHDNPINGNKADRQGRHSTGQTSVRTQQPWANLIPALHTLLPTQHPSHDKELNTEVHAAPCSASPLSTCVISCTGDAGYAASARPDPWYGSSRAGDAA